MLKHRSNGSRLIKVLIIDDDELTRDGLRTLLSAHSHSSFIVREAGDGLSALRCFKKDRPDVVLLDLKMPHMDGLETMR